MTVAGLSNSQSNSSNIYSVWRTRVLCISSCFAVTGLACGICRDVGLRDCGRLSCSRCSQAGSGRSHSLLHSGSSNCAGQHKRIPAVHPCNQIRWPGLHLVPDFSRNLFCNPAQHPSGLLQAVCPLQLLWLTVALSDLDHFSFTGFA
jgi:hypothetical protein